MNYILRVRKIAKGENYNKRFKFEFMDKYSLIVAIKVFNESQEFEVTSYTNF